MTSTNKMKMAHSIGADHVIDYTQASSPKTGDQYDLIIAVNGYHSIFDYKRALNNQGRCHDWRFLTSNVPINAHRAIYFSDRKVGKWLQCLSKLNQKDLVFMKELLEAGKVLPVIDRR